MLFSEMKLLGCIFRLTFLGFAVELGGIIQYLLYVNAQGPHIPYTSGVPAPAASPILGGVCNLRSGNPCVPEATCHPSVPIVGEAICQCPKGYNGDGKRPPQGQGCVNIDECAIQADDCTQRNMDCVDLPGSFRCECKPGYDLAPNKNFCIDVNECSGVNMNKCDGVTTTCFNLEGSYECRCIEDTMILDESSGSCRDLNECEDKGGVFNACDQLCTDKKPGFECSCKEGWQLAEDGIRCLDIDECALGLHTCNAYGDGGAQCKNTPGSYECVCSAEKGWVANMKNPQVCDNLNECKTHPYICGGPESCCGDLMPPDKFACMMPVSPAALASITPASNSNGLTFGGNSGSSTLGSPIDGFTSVSPARAPVGPAAAALAALAAASAAQSALAVQENDPRLINRNAQSTNTQTAPAACFEENVEYIGWNTLGGPIKAESTSVCHARCRSDPGCKFFSFNRTTNNCFLKASDSGRTANEGFISGPQFCARESSQHYSAGSQLMEPILSNGVQHPSDEIEGLSQPNNDIYSSNTNTISNNQYPRNGFHTIDGIINNVRTVVSPHGSPAYSTDRTGANIGATNVIGSVLGRFFSPTSQYVNTEALPRVSSDVIAGMSIDSQELYDAEAPFNHITLEALQDSSDYIVVVAGDKSHDSVMEELKTKLKTKLSNGTSISRRLQVLSNFRNSRGIIGGRLPSLASIAPRFSERSQQCPNGFHYGQELYRARVRQQAVNTFQTAVVGSVNNDGTITRGISPETLTDGIVKNSNLLAQRMTSWYNELATVPGELVTAGTTISQALDPSPVINAKAEAFNTTPANVMAATAIGTGLVVGGIADAVYGGGPGDSVILDRTGVSRHMAYGTI